MLKDRLGLDDKDIKLLASLTKDPGISQQELAKALGLSQPSVNVRLRKLRERGVLAVQAGIDAGQAGVSLARVDFTCPDPDQILSLLSRCSFFVNGFVMSGTRNVSAFLIGEDLRKVERIVNRYLRANPAVTDIELSVVVQVVKPFICSLDLAKEHAGPCDNPAGCEHCLQASGRTKPEKTPR
jgi:Lrp/AsnC family leucine-responsive transcriptional regulator